MSLSQIIESRTIGQLVVEHPERARFFESLGIDYCCAGRTSLEAACLKKGLNVLEVTAKLREFDATFGKTLERDWLHAPLGDLLDHIVLTHHRKMREDLPRIAALIAKVNNAHGDRHPELATLAKAFDLFSHDLMSHMEREESVLFPWIRRLDPDSEQEQTPFSIAKPIRIMMEEHGDAGESLELFSKLTGNYIPAPDACATFRVMLNSLKDLQADMHAHVHKENNILFPRALKAEGALPSH